MVHINSNAEGIPKSRANSKHIQSSESSLLIVHFGTTHNGDRRQCALDTFIICILTCVRLSLVWEPLIPSNAQSESRVARRGLINCVYKVFSVEGGERWLLLLLSLNLNMFLVYYRYYMVGIVFLFRSNLQYVPVHDLAT